MPLHIKVDGETDDYGPEMHHRHFYDQGVGSIELVTHPRRHSNCISGSIFTRVGESLPE